VTSELDRMLAEGPRVAPEPPVVSDNGSVVAPSPGRGKRRREIPRDGAARVTGARPLLARLWLPILFAAIVISSAGGHDYGWGVPLAILGFAAFRAWRRR
jgi:MYXO-CTERM domain-containing protein